MVGNKFFFKSHIVIVDLIFPTAPLLLCDLVAISFIISFPVFGVEPDLTREGGSIPVTLTLQETTGKNVMLLPIGACDDGAHSQNEKIDRLNYIEGVRSQNSLNWHHCFAFHD